MSYHGSRIEHQACWLSTTVATRRHCSCIVPSCLSVLGRTEMWLSDPVTAWNMGVSRLKSLHHTTAACLPCTIPSHNGLLSFVASLFEITSSFKIKVSLPSTQNLKLCMTRLPCCLPTLPLPHWLELKLSPPKEHCAEQPPDETWKTNTGNICKYRESEEAVKIKSTSFSILLFIFLISFIPSVSDY